MTNDERNPKPECRRALWCAIARSSFGFRYSFGFRHSIFGFESFGSWRALFRLFSACIGTMNRFVLVLVVLVLESKPPNRGRGRERRRGRKGGSWKALFRLFSACIGT